MARVVTGRGAAVHVERVEVPPDVGGVPVARRAAVAAVPDGVSQEVVDAVELVVSELVANAVLHGAPPVELVVAPGGEPGAVRIEVHDGSRTLPVRTLASEQGLTGRGLGLIDAVAANWGVDAAPTGKAVWVELTDESVRTAQPRDLDGDDLLATFPDWDDDTGPTRHTVTLGDVPTDLLLEAKAHVESLVRELTLTATGARSGMSSRVPTHLRALVDEIVGDFSEARLSIKRQAVAAAQRGDARTTLVLTLPASAAEAGERYLHALELADSYAHEERLLTLAAPPQHRAFRRWYVTSLVEALRRAAVGASPVPPPSFETHLLREIDHLATLRQISERAARLQRVTAAMAGALGKHEVADSVVREAAAELGAVRGLLLAPSSNGAMQVLAHVGLTAEQVAAVERSWSAGEPSAVRAAWTTAAPVWREAPATSAPGAASSCAVPLAVAGHLLGVLGLEFGEPRLFADDERAFLTALTATAAQAVERAELYEAQSDLADRLGKLQEVTTALTQAGDLDAVLDVVVTHATGLVGARNAALCLLRDDGHTVETARMVPSLGPDHGGWATFDVADETPASEALRTGEVVFAADLAERDRRWPAMAQYARDFEHAIVLLPLSGQGRTVGVVSLSFPAERGGPPALPLLRAFADACGQAVERARSAAAAEHSAGRLAFLARASAELAEPLDVERTLAGVARLSVPEIADWCVVHLLQDGQLQALAVEHVDPTKTALAWDVQRRWPSRITDPEGVAQVVRTGQPMHIPDIPQVLERLAATGGPQPERDPEHQAVLDSLGLLSCIVVPLTARGRTLGALTYITAESARRYDDDDLVFAQELARRAAIALDNARLFSAATQRQLDALPGGADDSGAASTARLLETMNDAFFHLDAQWRFSYVNGQAERLLRRGRDELLGARVWDLFPEAVGGPFEQSYERAVSTGRPVAFEAFFEPLDAWYEVRASPAGDGLSVFFHDVSQRKAAEDARAAASARLAVLAEATRELVGALDGDSVLRRLLGVLVPAMGTWAAVGLVDDDGDLAGAATEHADPAVGLSPDADPAGTADLLLRLPGAREVLTTRRGQLLPAPVLQPLRERLTPASALVVPLRAGGAVLGLLVVATSPDRPPLTPDDLATVDDIGSRAGLALQNARLFERQRTAVEVLQRSMLTALPHPEGLDLAARYRAAAEETQVGGDWYDAFQQPDGSTVLVIGDVMGHDVGAAAAMGQLRTLVRATAYDRQEPPAGVLSRVDAALAGLGIDTLATALVARLEQTADQRLRGARTLRWSSAGHVPALLRCADGRLVELRGPGDDLLLGLDPGTDRTDSLIELAEGDTLVLFTDGLVERRDSPLADGLDHLRAVLADVGDLPLQPLCDALLARTLPAAPDDDVALVAVRLQRLPVVPGPAGPPPSTAHATP